MQRRKFLQNLVVGAVSLAIPGAGQTGADGLPEQKPNILWLIADDLSCDLSCYGHELVETPNLETLASEGVVFTNAFTVSPVCSPARSALVTGMYPTTIGAHQHRTRKAEKPRMPVNGVEMVTEYFKDAGYFVANGNRRLNHGGKRDYSFIPSSDNVYEGYSWRQRGMEQPFFQQVQFHKAHRPFQRDKSNPIPADRVDLPPYYPDCPLLRRDWANYLEEVQLLDSEVGRLLDMLESDGLRDNTLVVFTADHGRAHFRAKQWLYEGGINIPLVVRWPGHLSQGRVDESLVNNIDLAPTSLDAAGIAIPDNIQGQNFLSDDASEREYIFAARDRCDETFDRVRCVRSARWKYIRNFYPQRPYMQFNAYKKYRYPAYALLKVWHKQGKLNRTQQRFMADEKPEEELYDLKNDPYEIHNLADEQEHQVLLEKYRRVLQRWIERTDDKGQIREDPEETEYWRREMHEYTPTRVDFPVYDISWEELLIHWEEKTLGETGSFPQ